MTTSLNRAISRFTPLLRKLLIKSEKLLSNHYFIMVVSPVIETHGLTRQFDGITAVDGLDLAVPTGEVLGFLGHNGAGKTTTVRLLNGVLSPTGGKAWVLGLDPVTNGPELRARTGVLTETPAVDERLTGYENLAIFGALYQVPESDLPGRIDELMNLFQLTDRSQDRVSEYSKGMKQKLALARALIHEPEVLFLDEPTAGLDPVITRQVHDLIREESRSGNRTVFLCTHNLDEAQRLCDRVALLQNGRMIALGAPSELAREIWPGVNLEIETQPKAVDSAVAALVAFSGASNVERTGESGVLSVSLNDRERIPDLVAFLVAAETPIFRLTPLEPTLEDVYFALNTDKGKES
jgi:ABC-2 type transport system ATP-binding protein